MTKERIWRIWILKQEMSAWAVVKQESLFWSKKIMIIISVLALGFLTACNKANSPTSDVIKKANTTSETPVVEDKVEKEVTNFLECEAMSGVIMESYPRQCKLGDLHFTEVLETNDWNKIEESVKDPEQETLNIKASKAELQQAFKDIEENMQVVDDNMQAMDVDDSELDAIGF